MLYLSSSPPLSFTSFSAPPFLGLLSSPVEFLEMRNVAERDLLAERGGRRPVFVAVLVEHAVFPQDAGSFLGTSHDGPPSLPQEPGEHILQVLPWKRVGLLQQTAGGQQEVTLKPFTDMCRRLSSVEQAHQVLLG